MVIKHLILVEHHMDVIVLIMVLKCFISLEILILEKHKQMISIFMIMQKQEEVKEWYDWIGKEIIKKSDKPFKSGKKIGVPIGIEQNPNSLKLAFRMKDDNTLVDCHQCNIK
jgi:hypothetical protein